MFELFPDQPAYEYSQMVNIIYSFVWAFVLSSITAITHKVTFTGDHYPKNFFQSLILGAIVTTMVMMAIGDSLARGLGVFGAMAIIRFRTRIDDPRDVLFLFAALSTGLAIGVYGFTISFAGTLLFCIAAFVLHYSSFRSYNYNSTLSFSLARPEGLPQVEMLLKRHTKRFKVLSMALDKGNILRYQYGIAINGDDNKRLLLDELSRIENLTVPKIAVAETNG